MRILAIETSCDETALAILSDREGKLILEKNQIYSQIDIHKKYGGVIPEVAARKHLETILPLLDDTLGDPAYGGKNIDYLAVTQGPGLVTSLLLGTTVAKTLAYLTKLPLIGVNHLEGHVYSNWLSNMALVKNSDKYFPSIILIVSGGHTELVLMTGHGEYQSIGSTLDDAVGEAYDKVAKLLDLGYPGGPIVSKLAQSGNPEKYHFPRPMIKSPDYNFSLSGLKTAVLYALEKKQTISNQDMADICASFQAAVVEVLVTKTTRAAKNFGARSVMLAGGVAANLALRQALSASASAQKLPVFCPDLKFTGDNAAMIAAAAYYQVKADRVNYVKNIFDFSPQANWQLTPK